MADPLSVAGSLAGLVTITDLVFCRAYKYWKAVKGAPAEAVALTSAIGAFSGILHNLYLLAHQMDGESFDTTTQIHHIHSCLKTVETVERFLDKYGKSSSGHGMDTMKRLRWPFMEPEAKSLTIQIERHKATLSLALAADGISGLLQALSGQKDIQSDLDVVKVELRQRREADTRIAVSKERQEVLAWIQIHDPRQNHEMSLNLRHPSTGVWLIESVEFQSWLSIPGSKLWCYGIPGAGKTVLASSVIQEALRRSQSNVAVAFFYCDYKIAETQDPRNIFGSIAKQLAIQDEQSFEKLQTFYESKNPKDLPRVDFSLEELRDLVVTMTSNFDDVMFIVDALDECGTAKQIRLVTRLLTSLNDGRGAGNSKTLFLSRDEPDIREILENYDHISIAASSSDLRLYVGAEIELRTRNRDLRIKDPNLKEQIMARLVEGADGMFRWAACQMDHICELPNDAARRKALDTLPPTLNATYERILQRVNASNSSVRQLVQKSLRWLVCTTIPINSRALCEATSVELGHQSLDWSAVPDGDEILRRCSSLVRRSVSGDWLELAHFTVKEFLTMDTGTFNPEYGLYHFEPDSDDIDLAETCLTYLSFRAFAVEGTICRDTLYQRWEEFAFREHAVIFWMKYAQKHLTKPKILTLIKQLLHPTKPYIFMSWAQEFLIAVVKVEKPDLTTAGPLHFAAALALPEVCEWLLENGCNVNQRSVVGTPLECALAGKAALSGIDCAIPIETPLAELGGPRMATVKTLINNGADVESSCLRSSPVYIAIAMSDMVSCIELMHKGAIIDRESAKWLFKYQKWQLSRGILENIDKNKIRNEDHATLLKAALMSEHLTANAWPGGLTHGLQYHAIADPVYLEAFETAAAYGQLSVVRHLLLVYKLDINAVSVSNGLTALRRAVTNDHVEVVEFLLKYGAECSQPDSEGRTLLHHAIQGGNRCLPLLLEQRIDIDLGDSHGLTAWHLAASIHNLSALHQLSEAAGNVRTLSRLKANDGRTPLHCAAQSGSIHTIAFFIDLGDENAIRDTALNGFTALHYAIEANSLEAVRYLVDNGADAHALTNDGSTTLHCALQRHDDPVVLEIVGLILRHGVDPCKARGDGMTSFHVLIENCHTAYAKHNAGRELRFLLNKLVQHASSLDPTDADGLTALHCVCRVQDVESRWYWRLIALEILLNSGASASVEDPSGNTALGYLVECWKTQVVDPAKEDLKFGDVTRSLVAMIKKTLACVDDTTLISTICTDSQFLCLALMFKEEALASEALKYCLSADMRVYQFSEMSPIEIACQYGSSCHLLAELLKKSNIGPGVAGSVAQLLRFTCERNHSSLETTIANLISSGLDPNDRTSESKTALMFAAQAGSSAVVKELIHHDADIFATDNRGCTIIHYACEAGNLQLLYLIKDMPMAWNTRIIVKLGTIWSRDATVSHLAASLDNCALEFLLKSNLVADINCLTQRKETPLYTAAARGISNNVSLLLDWHADDELANAMLESPLHAASRLGHLEVVMTFINKACHLQLKDGSGFSPGLVARKYGHVDIADILEERIPGKVMENGRSNDLEDTNILRLPPASLELAIESGDLDLCRALVAGGVDTDTGLPDCNGCTPVLYAFSEGQFDIAGYLISQGASIAGTACSVTPTQGYTPFHYAAGYGLVQILRNLFERTSGEIAHCCRPVHPIALAISNDHPECVKLIMDHARRGDNGANTEHVCEGSYDLSHLNSIRIRYDELRWPWYLPCGPTIQQLELTTATSLHIAAALDRVDIARSLINSGASVHAIDAHSWTPLHHAASQGQTQMVETLLCSGANPNAVDLTLRTPAMWAASRGYLSTMEILMKGGTDLTVKDRIGRTTLHWATASGAWDIAVLLINSSRSCDLKTISIDGDSVLSPALSTSPSFRTFLLNLAPDPSVYEPHQRNILSTIIATRNRLYFKKFLRRLPETLVPILLTHRALNMGTPLYAAATHAAEEVIDTLLDAGADLELEGGEYGTPLMGACAAGRLMIVKMLVLRGAKTSYVKGDRIISVMESARLHPKVIRWLLVGRFTKIPRLITNVND